MARQRLSALPARDLVVPGKSPASATGPVAGNGLLAEVLQYPRPYPSTHDSDFQSFVGKVVELAQILTGASGSAIAFRGEQGTICRARSGEGAPPLGAPVDTTSGISKQCLDSGTSLRCEDIATDGRVDNGISLAVGIRAVAVVPIYSNGDISGILEVFSNAPGVFTDHHLRTLQHLANGIGSAANMPNELPVLVSLRSPARLADSSSQTHGWNDILIDSHVPWKRFIESVFLHILIIGVLSGLSRIWPRELVLSPPSLREAHTIYYPFSQSFPARESSPPAVRPLQQHTSAHREVISAGRDRESLRASDTRDTDDAQKVHALTTPPPAMPAFASSLFQRPELGATAVPPPPDIHEAQARQSQPPDLSAVSPPPDLGGSSGFRKVNAPRTAVVPPSPDVRGSMRSAGLNDAAHLGVGSARAADISIVPPPPSLNDRATFTYGQTRVISNIGVQIVAPPSSVQDRAKSDAKARATSLGGGVSQVVPPPPSLEGVGNSFGGGRAPSPADGGSQVVPPAPSIQNGGNYGGGMRTGSLGQADSQVVPPPPSVQLGTGDSPGARGRASSLAGTRAEGALPPTSTQGEDNAKPGGARVEKDVAVSSEPASGADRKHRIFQEVQLHVITLTWAPPRSSYFSNFEVFIAEKWLNKKESEFIKLVYEFLPYQQRLSEYSYDDLKVHRLRVARDATCDESLMQMAWPEGDKGSAISDHAAATASISPDRNNALPCYRTTADDYRRAVSRSR